MAWSHFTGPLGEGDVFTAAARAELALAFEERLQALGGVGTGLDVTISAEIAASGLAGAAIFYNERARSGPHGAVFGSLTAREDAFHAAIGRICGWFAPPPLAALVAWTEVDLFSAAALTMGYSSEQWTAITAAAAEGLDSRAYWNICRAAIVLLDRVRLPSSAAAGWADAYTRRGDAPPGSPDPFADAVADFFTNTDAMASGYDVLGAVANYAGSASVTAGRNTGAMVVPSMDAFSAGYAVWARVQLGSSSEVGDAAWHVSWAGTDSDEFLVPGGGYFAPGDFELVTGQIATGSVEATAAMSVYGSAADWAPYAVFGSQAYITIASVWARPSWVYA